MFYFFMLSEQNIFVLLPVNLQQVCQKCVGRVQSQSLRKFCDGFVLRKKFSEFEGIFSAVCRRKLSVKVKTALYELKRKIWGQSLEKKFNLFKCSEQFILSDVVWKVLASCWVTAFLVSGEQLAGISFFRINFFRPFWTLGQKSSAKLPEHLFRCPVEQIEKNTFLSKKVQNVFGTLA